jgi:hypothetical protein
MLLHRSPQLSELLVTNADNLTAIDLSDTAVSGVVFYHGAEFDISDINKDLVSVEVEYAIHGTCFVNMYYNVVFTFRESRYSNFN